jgi:restriction system protein
MLDSRRIVRIMAGKGGVYLEDCLAGGFIAANWSLDFDLTPYYRDDWRAMNKVLIPKFLEFNPLKTKIAAGLACGALFVISVGLKNGDIILSPNGKGHYRFGEVNGGYQFKGSGDLAHARPVLWNTGSINRSDMSVELRNSCGSVGTISDITKYKQEIIRLMGIDTSGIVESKESTTDDQASFGLEKYLEAFLVENWKSTVFGQDYEIASDDGQVGQQFPTDTGPIDILARKKDLSEYLVVELKRGRASDSVVGQVQRYMGYIKEQVGEDTLVRGVIIALDDDLRIRRALQVANNIDFMRYEVKFRLLKT